MIEIIDAMKEEDGYFAIIEVPKEGKYRFGISKDSYKAIRKILQSRQLEAMPGLQYQYFWNGSMSGKTEKKIEIGIRCEVQESSKTFDFLVPHDFASNLKWFNELKSLDDAKHLKLET